MCICHEHTQLNLSYFSLVIKLNVLVRKRDLVVQENRRIGTRESNVECFVKLLTGIEYCENIDEVCYFKVKGKKGIR